MKNFILFLLAVLIGDFATLYLDRKFFQPAGGINSDPSGSSLYRPTSYLSNARLDSIGKAFAVGFSEAAPRSLEGVAHIRASSAARSGSREMLEDFSGPQCPFGEEPQQGDAQQSSCGSGVIIRPGAE